jgi:glycosyltransferase involved in cell wall biosynthesis
LQTHKQPSEAGGLDAPSRFAEQERLLGHQLRYLYAEVLQLKKERYEIVYTASWLVVRPLLRLEQALGAFIRRLFPPATAVSEAPAVPGPAVDGDTRAAEPRRILIDVTGTVERDMGTGIERVAKELSAALLAADPDHCLLARCDRGRLLRCVAPIGAKGREQDVELAIEPGDQFLILADAWNYPRAYAGVFDAVHAGGGRVIVCVHDVIPQLYPAACHERTVELFGPWLQDVLLGADGVLTVSRASGSDLVGLVEDRKLAHRKGLSIGSFHNASRFGPRGDATPREKVRQATREDAPVFLCVGTLEPRKGHLVALEAFEQLWAQGHGGRLIFVGRRGWFDYALVARITAHPQFGGRLFWFDDVDDAELAYLYGRMDALLCPSFAEGFGLPVIEAARCGKPVFCSDIPVFREVGRDGALYFRVNDPAALADAIRGWEAGVLQAHPDRVLSASWADAASRILDAIRKDRWDFRLA